MNKNMSEADRSALASSNEREPGLDAARVGAMFGVIVAHSLLAYLVTPIGWAISSPAGWIGVDLIAWIARSFLMPVFFVLAGHLAGRSMRKRGVASFTWQRVKRLVIPLVVFLVPVSFSMNALWDWGTELLPRTEIVSTVPKLEPSTLPLTLAHLWYLYYLIVFSAVAVALTVMLRYFNNEKTRQRFVEPGLSLLVIACVFCALLGSGGLQLDTPLGFGIVPWFALGYGAFFLWGWHADLPALIKNRNLWVPIGIIAFGLVASALIASRNGDVPSLFACFASALFSVAATGVFAGFLLGVRGKSTTLSWLASACYWTYLVHLPLVVLLQVAFSMVAIPPLVEIILTIATAITVSLLTYQLLVAKTVLSKFV